MLKSKAFVRKTKKGNVIKVVKEHYLRDDIFCGIPGCQSCPLPAGVTRDGSILESLVPDLSKPPAPPSLLSKSPRESKDAPRLAPHYVVLDTNAVFHQIDVIEHPAFKDVILLSTVLDELRHRSSAVYERVRNLIKDPERHFFVFCNEHHRDTYVERMDEESINDRNDRAIRKATSWYNAHLRQIDNRTGRVAVLVTDDADSRRRASVDDGIAAALSVREYVRTLESAHPELVDMVAAGEEEAEKIDDARKFTYEDHISAVQVVAGLKAGTLYQGSFGVSNHNYLEASISASDFSFVHAGKEVVASSILILGRANMNRAVHGDVVAVQLLPKLQWRRTVGTGVALEEERDEEDDSEAVVPEETAVGDAMDVDEDPNSEPPIPTGKVVGIIKRNWRPYCGTIEKLKGGTSSGATTRVYFWPMERRIPRIRIRTRQAAALQSQRILVAIDVWPKNSRLPMGHFVRSLGAVGDKATETEVLLLEHDVPYVAFSPQVLSFLPKEGEAWIVKEEHLEGRMDLRGLDVCSIDPPGCTDIDDTLHARTLPNGNIEIGVHIADVSNFVKSGNAMDLEAARRGTTVYLVDKRIDMLPSLLGTNLCSLMSNVDRLAFSVLWEMTPDAEVVNVKYTKSAIRSRASLTYDEAQALLDDPAKKDPVSLGIKALNRIAKILRKRRVEAGALTLASPEVRFKMERDTNDPVEVEMKELKDTNALVEEFMLLANIYVAKKIYETFPDSSMLRRHPKPRATQFESLLAALRPRGIELDISSSKSLSDSLDNAIDPKDAYFNKLVRIMTTRSMMQAVYFCSGTMGESDFWHYGLASSIYTHFTSPIRRYADLVVHRLLAAAIGYDKVYSAELTDKTKVDELSQVLNYRNRMAQMASRSSVELFTHLFFRGKIEQHEAYVTRILKNGFNVLVPRYGIEGFIQTDGDAKAFVYDKGANELRTSDAGGVKVGLFDRVVVQVSIQEAGISGQRSKLIVQLVEPFVNGFSVPSLPGGVGSVKVVGNVEVAEKETPQDTRPAKKKKGGR
ncbi:hypothetical protein BJ742DRAFT_813489 [Cladochytrium replicatum]|nr:hypothetical protein BJ742DRAFT_813489 [Cladochytrium replicatum]